MKPPVAVGIDPGIEGAVCVICGQDIEFFDTPTYQDGKKTRINESESADIIHRVKREYAGHEIRVAIEKVSSSPQMGVTSAFSFGDGYGMWRGIVVALKLPLDLVTPQAWKKAMMPGEPKEKDASRVVARRLFPVQTEEALSRRKDHNRADACLIAEYGRRKLQVK